MTQIYLSSFSCFLLWILLISSSLILHPFNLLFSVTSRNRNNPWCSFWHTIASHGLLTLREPPQFSLSSFTSCLLLRLEKQNKCNENNYFEIFIYPLGVLMKKMKKSFICLKVKVRENWIDKRKHQFIYLFFSKSQIFISKIGELGRNEILIKTLKIPLYINPFDIYIYINSTTIVFYKMILFH